MASVSDRSKVHERIVSALSLQIREDMGNWQAEMDLLQDLRQALAKSDRLGLR